MHALFLRVCPAKSSRQNQAHPHAHRHPRIIKGEDEQEHEDEKEFILNATNWILACLMLAG
jgi:hypothetical protein